jgi:DnaJ family protein A protein 5
MRCLYEILQVPRDADDDVIRKAYRKAALKYHPGKWCDATADGAALAV